MPQSFNQTFWNLVDKWGLPDRIALQLVRYQERRRQTDRRPQLKVSEDRARILSVMLEIDAAMAALDVKPFWLTTASGDPSLTPLDRLRTGATKEVMNALKTMHGKNNG